MIRRSLFFGLTLVLVVALVSLILRERRQEKLQTGQAVEVIKESASSPIRVYAPSDLEIVQSTAEFRKKSDGKNPSLSARHEIEIRNGGKMPYREIQIAFYYMDLKEKQLATKTHLLSRALLPGTSLKVTDIPVDALPLSTTNFKTAILYADLGENP
jgi:hypothetical protein